MQKRMRGGHISAKDLFCGGGGGSIGFHLAMLALFGDAQYGKVEWAINHNEQAVENHQKNFPETKHDCLDISKADPRRYDGAMILIAGPSCTDHSNAKGKKIVDQMQMSLPFDEEEDTLHDLNSERTRVTLFDIPRFAAIHQYLMILVENVEEIHHYRRYNEWISEMQKLGYHGKAVHFNSMFANISQSRDRWYYVWMRKDLPLPDLDFRPKAICASCGHAGGAIQTWKKNTKKWGKFGTATGSYFYRCEKCHQAVEPLIVPSWTALDFSMPIERIGSKKKPLATKTMRRIQAGIDRYGHIPIGVDLAHAEQLQGYARPLQTTPWPTLTTAQTLGFASPENESPFLVRLTHPDDDSIGKVFSVGAPTPTITTRQDLALVQPANIKGALIEMHGTSTARPLNRPCGTLLAGGTHHGLLQHPETAEAIQNGFLTTYYSEDNGHPLSLPAPTLTTVARHGLVTPPEASITLPDINDWYFRMLHTKELRKIAGFPDEQRYILEGSQRHITRMLGQAMSPVVIAMIIVRMLLCVPGIGIRKEDLATKNLPPVFYL